MTAKQDETEEALERLNGDYIYFRPKEYLIKEEAAWENRPWHYKIRRVLTAVFSKQPVKAVDATSDLDLIQRLREDSQFGKHVAGKDNLSDDDWRHLLYTGYFHSNSPYMQLYLHDVRISKAYEAAKHAQEEDNLKHREADNKARNLNRKVGKRGMTR